MAKRTRVVKLAPLSEDAGHIARSLTFAATDIATFRDDPRMAFHALSRDFCSDQAAYYAAMAEDWRKLAERLKEAGA